MCGRFALTHTTEELVDYFAIEEVQATVTPRYNLAPTQPVVAVLQRDRRVLELLNWGLVPSWSRDPSGGSRAINARVETLTTKPTFRNAFQHRRCVVLASGLFEWRREGQTRIPMFIRPADGRPLGLAGLWEEWTPTEGEPLRTCTIITVAANPFLARIHDRMPAILEPAAVSRWLDLKAAGAEPLLELLRPYAADDLVAHPVSSRVNQVTYDQPDCVIAVPAEGNLSLFQ